MIKRIYIVSFPGTQRTTPNYVDICVRATMGTRALPIANPVTYGAANVTAPPANWAAACGDAAYYELRGRTLSIEHLFAAGAAGGFSERARLGFDLIVTPYGDWSSVQGLSPPSAQLSQSLLAAVGGDVGGAVPATNLADPTYGVVQSVIRIFTPRVGQTPILGKLVLVHFNIAERKDEDFSSVGGV
jgi:hypothetical protein